MTATVPPYAEQRYLALARANAVRSERARLLGSTAGRKTVSPERVAELVLEVPEALANMEIEDVLVRAQRWREARVRGLLARLGISGVRSLGALSVRQREQIAARLRGEQ